MTDTEHRTGPITSTGHLTAAAESIRQAMHIDGPATPPECADEIGALHTITAALEQHLDRVAAALDEASADERLQDLTGAELRHLAGSPVPSDQAAATARAVAFHLRGICGAHLRGLVRELNIALGEAAGLSFHTPTAATTPAPPPTDYARGIDAMTEHVNDLLDGLGAPPAGELTDSDRSV